MVLAQSMKVLIPPPVLKSVPNVVGGTSAIAAAVIRAAAFGVSIASVVDPTCNNIGTVTGQLPRGGSMAPQGSAVTIWVAVRPKTACP